MTDEQSDIVDRWPVTIVRTGEGTRASAPYLLGAGPTFGLTVAPPPKAAPSIEQTRKNDDTTRVPPALPPPGDSIMIGEDDFGLRAQVHTRNRRSLARALSAAAQGALVRVPHLRSASGDGGRVVLVVHGEPATEDQRLLTEAVLTIARHSGGLVPALEAAGGAMEITSDRDGARTGAITFQGSGGTVRFDGITVAAEVLPRGRIDARTPVFETRIHDGALADRDIAAAVIPPETHDHVVALGDATLAGDGAVAVLVLLGDPTPEVPRILAAVALLGAIAVAGRRIGVFR